MFLGWNLRWFLGRNSIKRRKLALFIINPDRIIWARSIWVAFQLILLSLVVWIALFYRREKDPRGELNWIPMERMLYQVLMGSEGGGQSLLSTIKIAVLPIAKVFTVCFLGFLMATKYVNILPPNGRKLLNGVRNFLCLFSFSVVFFFFLLSDLLVLHLYCQTEPIFLYFG